MTQTDENTSSSPPIITTRPATRAVAAALGFILAFTLTLGGGWAYKTITAAKADWPGTVTSADLSRWMADATPSITVSDDDVETLTGAACKEYTNPDDDTTTVADAVGNAIKDNGLNITTDVSDEERDTIISAMALTYRCPSYIGREFK